MANCWAVLWLGVSSLTGAASADAGGAARRLSNGGKTDYCIVLDRLAAPAEKTAASELQDHLLLVTGARFEIRTDDQVPPAAPRIVVGPGSAFRAACPEIKLDTLGRDGIVMKTVGGDLFLAGPPPRGTLNAVYTFLEDVVGCRWWSSREGESYTPRRADLPLPALNTVYVPRLQYREAFYRDALDGRFAARSRCNGHFARIPPELGGHYSILGWCHTFYPLLPPQKYFKDHPEWYSLLHNRRTHQQAQLCLTNPAMRAELTRNALAWIRANPQAGMISISQNDWAGPCHCPDCLAVVQRENAHAGPLLEMVNSVAADIEKEFPDFLVETLAYMYTRPPPRTVRPRKNVVVRLCSIECSFSQPLGSGEQNARFRRDIEAWSTIAPRLYIWDYTTVFSNYMQPHPNLRVLGPNIRFLVDHKAVGLFEQGDAGCSCSDFPELRAWLLAHLMWDPSRDDQALIDEFLRGYYGPAAPSLREYIDLLHDAVEREKTYLGCFLGETSGWLKLETMNRAADLFEQAAAAVAADAALGKRVRRARMPLDHVWILRHEELKRSARLTGQPFRGPADLEAFVGEFIRSAREFGVVQYCENGGFDRYAPQLLAMARPASPPDLCRDLAQDDWLDFQEKAFRLSGRGNWCEIVDDKAASNGRAVRMPANHPQWAFQWAVPPELEGKGRWRVFVSARCQAKTPTDRGFQLGVHDAAGKRGLAYVPVNSDHVGRGPGPTSAPASRPAAPGSGEYHTFDLGVHDMRAGLYVWAAPFNNPEQVDAIFVDRVFLVRAK